MGTWDDNVKEQFDMLAGGMLTLAILLDKMIAESLEGEDTTLLRSTRDWLRARSNVFAPPGEPESGYPAGENLAPIINLEAYRAWKSLKAERERG